MRFITFVKRCDTPTMIRCMMAAFEYFEGLPQAALTDRMKSVFLDMDGTTPIWMIPSLRTLRPVWALPLASAGHTNHERKAKLREALESLKMAFGQACGLRILMM